MYVWELFAKADPELVFYAYTLVRLVFSEYGEYDIAEQSKILRGLKRHIKEYCEKISDSDIDYSCEAHTIFCLNMKESAYRQSYKRIFGCHVIKDEEAQSALGKNFTIWNDEGETRIEHYGIDFISVAELAGYMVAEQSVENLGIEVCCACILQDLFEWGLTEEARKEHFEELKEMLDESMKDLDEGRYTSAEELFEDLDKEILAEASDDEREYWRLEKEFKRKVREIERRYSQKINDENHKMFIDAVKNEYGNRFFC